MRLHSLLRLAAVATTVSFVGLLVGLVTNVASAQPRWPGWLEVVRTSPWQSLVILGAAAAILATLGAVLPASDVAGLIRVERSSLDLAGVADDLARAVRRQWGYEAAWRRVYDPYAIPVRWTAADPALFADWATLVRLATTGPGWPKQRVENWASDPSGLAGEDNDLLVVLDRVPTGRLVILGEPGAGKTILLLRLVLALLARRGHGEAVPILLPLASWNPEDEDLESWAIRRLITENVALAEPAPARAGVSRAQALFDADLILLVLDGLDEIPDKVRSRAIARINDAMRPGWSMVLAARSDEYQTAVKPSKRSEIQLAGAVGIELCPLDAGVVADYLRKSAGGSTGAARWDAVFTAFDVDQRPPIAQVLTTPLMTGLARAVYNPRPGEELVTIGGEPVELLDQTRFPSREAIELHLFECLIPAAYRRHPDREKRCKWTAQQAKRWLVYLARDLEHRQHGTTDIAWWELHGAVPRSLSGVTVALVAGIAGTLGFPFIGLGVQFILALLVGLLVRNPVQRSEAWLLRGLAGGLVGGMTGALVAWALLGLSLQGDVLGGGGSRLAAIVAAGLAVGIAVAALGTFVAGFVGAMVGELVVGFYEHGPVFAEVRATVGDWSMLANGIGLGLASGLAAGLVKRRAPARGFRWSRLGFVTGLGVGVTIGFVVWLQVRSVGCLLVALVTTITGGYAGGIFFEAASTDLAKATAPRTVLMRDRATFRSSFLGLGLALGLALVLRSDTVRAT